MADSDQTAFAGAFGTEIEVADLLLKLACKIITESCPGECIFVIFFRKSSVSVRNLDTYMRRGCERVTLDMVDGEKLVSELIDALQTFICGITFSIYGMKLLTQFF